MDKETKQNREESVADDANTNPEGKKDSTVENTGENSEKIFTQKELDEIITKRLAREKTSVGAVSKQFEQEIEGLTQQVENYQKIINQMLAKELDSFDPAVKELLDKLSVEDKIAWIAKNKDGAQRRTIPLTPNAGNKDVNATPTKKQRLF